MRRYINIFKNLMQIANGKKLLILQLFISSALNNLASLLPPIATAGIIKVLTENNFMGIWFYVILYLIFYAIYFLALRWNYATYGKLGSYYHLDVQRKIFNTVASNEAIFKKFSRGKIIDTCSEDVCYLVDVVDSIVEIIMRIIKLFIIIGIFIHYNIFVAIIVILVDYAYIKLMNDNSKAVSKHYEGTRKYNDKIIDTLNQMLINLKPVKTFNMLPNLNKKLDKTRKKWQEEYKLRRDSLTDRYSKIPIILYLAKIFLYTFLGFLVVKNKMTIDTLILLISYFEMTITCTDYTLEYLLNLSNYGIRVNRIKMILDYTPEKEINFGNLDNDYINGLVEFKNVTYKIKNKIILNNISFKLYPNSINVIVGKSGSGKTTIINLLYRLNKINSGKILIDNENIYDYSKSVYFSNVSGVYQKPFVFDMSIKDNLSLVCNDTYEQIEACKRVGLHKFIMSLPNDYNTQIGEDNHVFTEGDKQLLMIARALLSNAEILLFDEVTSNVDNKTTDKIKKILNDLKIDHTIILVTHKAEMMDLADNIIVLDNGKVSSTGTNDELLKKSSIYQDLKNRTFASVSNIDKEV